MQVLARELDAFNPSVLAVDGVGHDISAPDGLTDEPLIMVPGVTTACPDATR